MYIHELGNIIRYGVNVLFICNSNKNNNIYLKSNIQSNFYKDTSSVDLHQMHRNNKYVSRSVWPQKRVTHTIN